MICQQDSYLLYFEASLNSVGIVVITKRFLNLSKKILPDKSCHSFVRIIDVLSLKTFFLVQ